MRTFLSGSHPDISDFRKGITMKKILAMMLVLVMLLPMASAMAEETEYVFEAEYTELEGLEGLGVSGSPTGLGLVSESAKASNGYFVGNLGTSSPITFVINSDTDTVATLKLVVGSNILGNCAWNPTTLKIIVNDEEIEYYEFTTDNGDDPMDQNTFKTKKIGDINFVAGENTIVIVAGENSYRSNLPSAPSIDAIKLSTAAALEMVESEASHEELD